MCVWSRLGKTRKDSLCCLKDALGGKRRTHGFTNSQRAQRRGTQIGNGAIQRHLTISKQHLQHTLNTGLGLFPLILSLPVPVSALHICLFLQVTGFGAQAPARLFSQTKDLWKPNLSSWHILLLKSLLPELHKLYTWQVPAWSTRTKALTYSPQSVSPRWLLLMQEGLS